MTRGGQQLGDFFAAFVMFDAARIAQL